MRKNSNDLCETHDLDLVPYDKKENLQLYNFHRDILDIAGFTLLAWFYCSSESRQQLSEVNNT